MVQLDDQEELAPKGSLQTLEAQHFDPKPKINQNIYPVGLKVRLEKRRNVNDAKP